MDDTDQKLLALLQLNARESATTLAARLGVSRGTVQNRIDRMLDQGIIHRFGVALGPGIADQQISAFTLLRVKADDGRAVLAALRRVGGVLEVSTLSGAADFVVELRAPSLTAMDRILDQIRAIPDVAETHCHIRLTTTPVQP